MILEIFKQVKHSRPCGLKAICGSSNNETFPFLDSYFLKTYAKKIVFKNQRFIAMCTNFVGK